MKNKEPHKKTYSVFKFLIKLYITIVYHPKYVNTDYMPKEGAVILAGNHKNNFDSLLACGSSKRMVHYMAKQELHKSVIGKFFEWVGTIPVDRSIHDENAKTKAIEVLEDGYVLGIFPEGTRNLTVDKLTLPFKFGAVSMAKKTGATIVPFSITGDYKLFNKNLKITYEKPFKVGNMNLEEANAKLEKIIGDSILKNRKK